VIWIQGILDVVRHHFFGNMSCLERLRNPRLLWNYHRMTVDAAREREVFRRCRYFIGRTSWDAAQQARLQPQGDYYLVQECIRPEFSAATPWNRGEVKGTTIYTTTSTSLYKGTDVLVHAIGLLRSRFPDIHLRVAGFMGSTNPVARRLRRLVCELELSNHVEFVGQLDGAQIVRELRQARVFVLPSFIENNPNSLAEAQLVGTPVVAAFAGGIPDMMMDGEMGLGFQPGDSATLAWQIARLLTDDPLAARLARRARAIAHDRHSPGRIVESLLRAYDGIVQSSSRSQS
jgi:glycosyltransferase involved in cell wall biosynthesis